jgi:hypothetical protein
VDGGIRGSCRLGVSANGVGASTASLGAAKSDVMTAITGTESGLNCSASRRASIEACITALEALSPTQQPASSHLVDGNWRVLMNPQPIALSPQPSALNLHSPQPSTLQPSALNLHSPQPSTLSPQPSALSPQPSALSPQPSQPSALNPHSPHGPQPSALRPQASGLRPQASGISSQLSALNPHSPQPSTLGPYP